MKDVSCVGLTIFLFILVAFQPAVLVGNDKPKVEEDKITPTRWMSVFSTYTGKWVSSIKGEASAMFEKDYERTTEWEGRFILDGKMFQMSGIDDLGGEANEYMWLFAYDDVQKKYVAWYHDEEGVHLKFKRVVFDQDKENKISELYT